MAAATENYQGNGCILIMEGDKKVRASITELLVSLHYHVVATPDSKTTLEAYCRKWEVGDPFDLVFIDCTQLSGKYDANIFHQLVKLNPKV